LIVVSAPPVGAKAILKEVLRTKSGIIAIAILAFLVCVVVIVPLYAPYDVVKKWNDPRAWLDNPRCAAPEWVELMVGKKLPRTIKISMEDFRATKYSTVLSHGNLTIKLIRMMAYFDYDYDDFPSEFGIMANMTCLKGMKVDIKLIRPDGDEILLLSKVFSSGESSFMLSSGDSEVKLIASNYVAEVTGISPSLRLPQVILFAEKSEDMWNPSKAKVLKGRYKIVLEATSFTPEDDIDLEVIIYGKVFGVFGTDSLRRDLLVGLLWGAPVALAFALTAATAVTLIQTFLGIVSGYFGGKVDEIIQRFTDLMMIIPVLPILILISFLYRIGIWLLLVIIVGFSIVGSTTKVVRSMVLQIKEEQYILAAVSYGASSWRIIFRHIFPRVLPYTFSLIALAVPSYIFLEAALSFLGLGDPVLPTWGKILGEAHAEGAAYYGYWWWILIPAGFIALTAIAFALLGYAIDKIVNPRLREI